MQKKDKAKSLPCIKHAAMVETKTTQSLEFDLYKRPRQRVNVNSVIPGKKQSPGNKVIHKSQQNIMTWLKSCIQY